MQVELDGRVAVARNGGGETSSRSSLTTVDVIDESFACINGYPNPIAVTPYHVGQSITIKVCVGYFRKGSGLCAIETE